jgi:hypothetical protein
MSMRKISSQIQGGHCYDELPSGEVMWDYNSQSWLLIKVSCSGDAKIKWWGDVRFQQSRSLIRSFEFERRQNSCERLKIVELDDNSEGTRLGMNLASIMSVMWYILGVSWQEVTSTVNDVIEIDRTIILHMQRIWNQKVLKWTADMFTNWCAGELTDLHQDHESLPMSHLSAFISPFPAGYEFSRLGNSFAGLMMDVMMIVKFTRLGIIEPSIYDVGEAIELFFNLTRVFDGSQLFWINK